MYHSGRFPFRPPEEGAALRIGPLEPGQPDDEFHLYIDPGETERVLRISQPVEDAPFVLVIRLVLESVAPGRDVLTSLRPTPYARGNSQHTVLAQVEKLPPEAALRGLRVLCLGGDAMAGIDGRSFVEDVAARYGCDMTKCVAPGGTLADCLRLGEAPAEAAPFDLLLCELPAAGASAQSADLDAMDDASYYRLTMN